VRKRESERESERERKKKKNREGEKEVGRERVITVGCLWQVMRLRAVEMYSCHIMEK
jgi:hypothetical protein